MADKVYPTTHTGITAYLLRRSRRHMDAISLGTSGDGLIPTPNDGTNIFISDDTTVPLDGNFHYVTWTSYAGMPAWASVASAGSLNFNITDPGMYVAMLLFNVFTAPTTPDQEIVVDGPFLLEMSENVTDLDNAKSIAGGSFPTSDLETAVLATSDVPWITFWRIKTPTDATGVLNVTANVQQVAHLGSTGSLASGVGNDSSVSGTTVADALDSLLGGEGLTVTDGTTSVHPAKTITLSGGTVTDGGSGNAQVAVTGGGHTIGIKDAGGSTVTSDVETVEFTGTAVTSVVDDGSGNTTVTLDAGGGGGGNQCQLIASLNSDGIFSGYGYIIVEDGGVARSCNIALPVQALTAGQGFNVDVFADVYAGGGTIKLSGCQLMITNPAGTEAVTAGIVAQVDLTPSTDYQVVFPPLSVWAGTDLVRDGTNTIVESMAGGMFEVSLIVEAYITP